MRLTLPLLFAFLPTLAFADSYNFANCSFVKQQQGWAIDFALRATRDVARTDMVEADIGVPDASFCNLLHGNGDVTQADLDLYYAVGSGLHADGKCSFLGQVDQVANLHKVLHEGEYAVLEQPRPMTETSREAVYLASASEAALPGWEGKACQRILKSMNDEDFGD